MGGVYFVSIFVYLHLKFYYCFIMHVTVFKEFFLLMFFMLILTTVIFYLRIRFSLCFINNCVYSCRLYDDNLDKYMNFYN